LESKIAHAAQVFFESLDFIGQRKQLRFLVLHGFLGAGEIAVQGIVIHEKAPEKNIGGHQGEKKSQEDDANPAPEAYSP